MLKKKLFSSPYPENSTVKEELEVQLALALCGTHPAGECPSMEDIIAWQDGCEDKQKSAGIENHVANCEYCFTLWVQWLDADRVEQPEISMWRAGWSKLRRMLYRPRLPEKVVLTRSSTQTVYPKRFVLGGGFAAAMVGLLAWIVVLPGLESPSIVATVDESYGFFQALNLSQDVPNNWRWKDGWQAKAIGSDQIATNRKINDRNPVTEKQALHAFRVGVRKGIGELVGHSRFWNSIEEQLPSSAVICRDNSNSTNCLASEKLLQEVGRWAALMHLSCESLKSSKTDGKNALEQNTKFWMHQAEVIINLHDALSQSLPSSSFTRFFLNWKEQLTESKEQPADFCRKSARLMSFGMVM